VPFGTTETDISGFWSYTVGQPGTVTYPLGSGSIVGSLLGSVLGLVQGLTSGSGLADGTFNVTATAMDIAGTTSAPSSTLTVVIDTQPPPAPAGIAISPDTGTNKAAGITTAQNLTISGTAQSGSMVAVLLNGVLPGDTMAGTNHQQRGLYEPVVRRVNLQCLN